MNQRKQAGLEETRPKRETEIFHAECDVGASRSFARKPHGGVAIYVMRFKNRHVNLLQRSRIDPASPRKSRRGKAKGASRAITSTRSSSIISDYFTSNEKFLSKTLREKSSYTIFLRAKSAIRRRSSRSTKIYSRSPRPNFAQRHVDRPERGVNGP